MRGNNASVTVHSKKHPYYHQALSPIQKSAIYQYAFSHTKKKKKMFRIKNLTSSCNTSTPPLPQTCIVPPHDPSRRSQDPRKQKTILIPISPVVQTLNTHRRNMISTLFCNTYDALIFFKMCQNFEKWGRYQCSTEAIREYQFYIYQSLPDP